MPIKDTAAMNASLDNDYGATKGPNSPSSHQLALFVGDPQIAEEDDGGIEISSVNNPGYARATVPNDATWAPAEDGFKKTVDSIEMAAPTAAWLDEPTHWALIASGEVVWDTGPFLEPMQITGSSVDPILVNPVVFYSDSIIEEEE